MAGRLTKEELLNLNKKLRADYDEVDIKEEYSDYNEVNVDVKEVDIKEDLITEPTIKENIEAGIKIAELVKNETKDLAKTIIANNESIELIADTYENLAWNTEVVKHNHIEDMSEQNKNLTVLKKQLDSSVSTRNEAIEATDSLFITWPTSWLGYAAIGVGVTVGLLGLSWLARNYITTENTLPQTPTITIVEETIVNTQTINIGGLNIGTIVNQSTTTTITQTLPNETITTFDNLPNTENLYKVIDNIIKK